MVREKFPKLIYVFSLGKKKLYLICIGSSALHATWATILLVEALSSHPHESVTKEMLVSNFGRSLQPYYTGDELLPAGQIPKNVIVKISQLPSAGSVSTADFHPQETQGMIAGVVAVVACESTGKHACWPVAALSVGRALLGL